MKEVIDNNCLEVGSSAGRKDYKDGLETRSVRTSRDFDEAPVLDIMKVESPA